MVLRVQPTPTQSPTTSLYTQMDNAPLRSISNVRSRSTNGTQSLRLTRRMRWTLSLLKTSTILLSANLMGHVFQP